MPLDLVKTLSELVAIPSVNPMGRPLFGPEFLEHRLTEYLEQLFQRLGLPYVRQTIEPRRDNIVARLEGTVPPERGGPLIMFEAHQDTVPVDGMTIPPWEPAVRDGRLYGRGACDIKGGMAAMLWALARLAEDRTAGHREAPLPTLIMACTVNEEHGFSGAQDLRRLWEGEAAGLIPRRPDACIVAEPTSLQVVVAHKGAVRWRLSTFGRAVHSSQPHLGDNAIYKMARVLLALQQYAADVQDNVPHHPLCGPATLSVGTISGGISVNTVPDRCTIEIDRRLLPGEDTQAAYADVQRYVARAVGSGLALEHEPPFLIGPALADTDNQALGALLAEVARGVVGHCQLVGVPYGTDASKIAAAGVPSVVFGPGSIAQAHTADEWIDLSELALAAEVYYRFARSYG